MKKLSNPEPLYASRASIEQYAELVAKQLEYEYSSDFETIIGDLGGTLRYKEEIEHFEEDGSLIVRGPNDFDIEISPFAGRERNRFTIAHELGHYFLHSRQGEKPIRAKRLGTGQVEWEANWFAAAFLMPRSRFKEMFAEFDGNLRFVASVFNVSVAAAEVHAKVLKLIS